MNVFDILDEIDDMLEHSKAFPLAAHKIVIDGDRLRELVNDIRLAMPKEMKRAQTIDYDCDRIMKEAQSNAESVIREAEDRAKVVVKDAEQRAKEMVAESAIVAEAKKKAQEALTRTKQKCDETKQATAAYVSQSLTQTESQIRDLLGQIQKERAIWDKQ